MESRQEEEEMDVYLKIKKTVAFKVKRSDKIKHLKSLVRKKEGVAENLQDLFYDGQRLKDEDKLVDHGIRSKTTLNLYLQGDVTKLFVSVPADETTTGQRIVVLELTTRDTVKNIKYLIRAKAGIEIDTYTLFYHGKQLQDDATLASLCIPRNSTLSLVFTPRDSLSVSVELLSGEVLKLEVKYMHLIRDLKAIIRSWGHSLVSGEEDLYYAGERLNDHKTVASYDLNPNSTLQVVPYDIQIFVRKWDGKTVAFSVNPKDTILDLKKQILSKLRLPVHVYWLQFSGKVLKDNQNLASYNIRKHATLFIHFRNENYHGNEISNGKV